MYVKIKLYVTQKICNKLVAITKCKVPLKLNKSVSIGMCILEVLIYEFHYDFIKNKYDDNKSKLLFTDADSLMYSIEGKDVFIFARRQ